MCDCLDRCVLVKRLLLVLRSRRLEVESDCQPLLGIWWLDPIVALGIATLAVLEGRRAWRGEGCACATCASPEDLVYWALPSLMVAEERITTKYPQPDSNRRSPA